MTHIYRQQDRDLHWEDGSHRWTPGSTDGGVLETYERRIRAHLKMLRSARQPAQVTELPPMPDELKRELRRLIWGTP